MKILTTPNPFLRKVAKPVNALNKKIEAEISQMLTTLKAAKNPEGVGLAATQVGLDRRIFIVILNGKPEIFINPEIVNKSDAVFSDIYKKPKDRWLEGCLSIPGVWGFVDRPYWVEIEYVTPDNGELKPKKRKFETMESAFVQHENDHLNGILFTDHVLNQNGQLLRETESGLIPISSI